MKGIGSGIEYPADPWSVPGEVFANALYDTLPARNLVLAGTG